MKLRVKLHQRSQIIELDQREPSSITLSELKDVVTSRFSLENHNFHLSLNKIDDLPSDDDNTLSSAGIVSGDLLHIIGSNLPQLSPASTAPQPPQSMDSNGSLSREPSAQSSDVSMVSVVSSSSETEKSNNRNNYDGTQSSQETPSIVGQTSQGTSSFVGETSQETSTFIEQTTTETVTDSESDVQVNRFLLEPLVVRESTATQVPVLLEQLYRSAACNCATDAVWVVIHTLMLESGFLPVMSTDITQIPSDWKQSGFYKCVYHLPFPGTEAAQCSVVGVPMATSLIVHGLSRPEASFKTEHVQVKTTEYVTNLSEDVASVFIGLDRLSRLFKDTVCLPLQNELATVAGLPGGQGFTSLPYEIKVRILSCLDALTLCHVIQTDYSLGALAKENMIWRRIYIRDFGKPSNSDLNREWYELYKTEFLQRREDRQRRRQFQFNEEPFFRIPGNLRPLPLPGLPFPPRMIGGDYDLNPEFASGGIPNPMGSGPGRRPGPILPNVRIPDPLCSDPFRLGGMGRRPARGNMTGSPFGVGDRGGLFRSPFM